MVQCFKARLENAALLLFAYSRNSKTYGERVLVMKHVSPVLLSSEIYLFLTNIRRYVGFEIITAVVNFFLMCHIVRQKPTDVSEEYIASIFRIQKRFFLLVSY
jgi:hypothetical protein